MPIINPTAEDQLVGALASTFDFNDFGSLLFKCTKDRTVIHEIASENWPLKKTAQLCVQEMQSRNYTRLFFAYVVLERPDDNELRILIESVVPDALSQLPEIKAEVDRITASLAAAENRIGYLEISGRLRDSRAILQQIVDGIVLLDVFKNLHDALHHLQMRQMSKLIAATRRIDDEAAHDSLRDYKSQLRLAASTAKTALGRLSDHPITHTEEKPWISELESLFALFDKALAARNAPAARATTFKVARLLESHPKRLNNKIVTTVGSLPLYQLATALKVAGASANGAGGDIGVAGKSLEDLDAVLRSRVAEHNVWQTVDDDLWALDRVFEQSVDQVVDFAEIWPTLKSNSEALSRDKSTENWSTRFLEFAAAIDDALLQAVKVDVAVANRALGLAYSNFRDEARFRFLEVDGFLKDECAHLTRMREPLEKILGK